MLFAILVILAIFIGPCVIMKAKNAYGLTVFDLCLASLATLFALTAIICFIMAIFSFVAFEFASPEVEYTEIKSLSPSTNVDGFFFLGCGRISGKLVYIFYQKISDNQYIQKKINADGVIIEENDEVGPCVEFETKKIPNWFYTWIGPVAKETKTPVKIIVPKNTIVKEFKL